MVEMARPLRLEYPGAVYHVMSRGHERSAIFREDGDREKFHSVLGAVVGDERWELHGYCLMGNHYHLLVETPEGQLSRGMKALEQQVCAVVQLAAWASGSSAGEPVSVGARPEG